MEDAPLAISEDIGHWRTLEATPCHGRSTAATASTPPWPSPLGAPGISLTRPSCSLEPWVTHAHAVTTPLEPRSAPVRLAVITMSLWPLGNPYRPHENPSPALSTGRPRHAPTEPLKPLPAQPRHREACTGDFTVGGHRRTTVARVLGSPSRRPDPTIAVVEA